MVLALSRALITSPGSTVEGISIAANTAPPSSVLTPAMTSRPEDGGQLLQSDGAVSLGLVEGASEAFARLPFRQASTRASRSPRCCRSRQRRLLAAFIS